VNGRPRWEETQYGPKPVHASHANDCAIGWRREHAHRCWSQLQLFVCWLVLRDAQTGLKHALARAAQCELREMRLGR
jgi:hypothetical protein